MTKRFFIAVVAVFMVALSAVADGKQAEATFSIKSHDFGTIQEAKGPVSCTFEFTNTGDKPLLIIDATASCGCTRPEYPSTSFPRNRSDTGVVHSDTACHNCDFACRSAPGYMA